MKTHSTSPKRPRRCTKFPVAAWPWASRAAPPRWLTAAGRPSATRAKRPTLGEIQADQISRYRAAWKEAGHDWTPRVSVSRSVFPIVDGADMQLFGMQASGSDQVGTLPDVGASTFGRTYAAEPDKLIDQLKADAAVMSADTLLITIPAGMGVDDNVKILDNFATHVAPRVGLAAERRKPGYRLSHRLIPAGRKLFASMSVQCVLNSSVLAV